MSRVHDALGEVRFRAHLKLLSAAAIESARSDTRRLAVDENLRIARAARKALLLVLAPRKEGADARGDSEEWPQPAARRVSVLAQIRSHPSKVLLFLLRAGAGRIISNRCPLQTILAPACNGLLLLLLLLGVPDGPVRRRGRINLLICVQRGELN